MTERVDRVETCELNVVEGAWDYAPRNAMAIDAHWQRRTAESPGFFNGTVYVARSALIDGSRLSASFVRTDFKSFLYWREHGYVPEAEAYDAFGAAIICSADGAVLLARQHPGQVNDGLVYLPSGFIDAHDVADGRIDIAASIAREVQEETHMGPDELVPQSGFLVVRTGAQVAICRELVSALPAEALRTRILENLTREENPELADLVIVRTLADLDGHNVPPHTRRALQAILLEA